MLQEALLLKFKFNIYLHEYNFSLFYFNINITFARIDQKTTHKFINSIKLYFNL